MRKDPLEREMGMAPLTSVISGLIEPALNLPLCCQVSMGAEQREAICITHQVKYSTNAQEIL